MQIFNREVASQAKEPLKPEASICKVETSIDASEPKKIKLIYRALIFERLLTPECPDHQPRAVNWRFRIPGKNYNLTPVSELVPLRPYPQARAVNWRFQPHSQAWIN